MAAGKHDFTWEQGVTLDAPIIWKDANQDPVDVTGFTARMQVRSSITSNTVLYEFTTANNGITVDGAAGTFTLQASAATTAAWNWPTQQGQSTPSAVYDLEVISPGGIVTRLLKGGISLDPEVTR